MSMSNGSVSVPKHSMMTTEDGESELVLGNKQLLSVFVIVVVLLGVFFAMGYVVGRSSTPVDTAGRRPETEYVRSDAPSAMGARTPKAEAETPSSEGPAASDEPTPSAAEPSKVRPIRELAGPTERTQAAASALAEPAAGQTFLQVGAVAKPEADVLMRVLQKKGFHARIAPGPNDALVRVLVGPARETAGIAQLKAELEQAGFKSFVKKY